MKNTVAFKTNGGPVVINLVKIGTGASDQGSGLPSIMSSLMLKIRMMVEDKPNGLNMELDKIDEQMKRMEIDGLKSGSILAKGKLKASGSAAGAAEVFMGKYSLVYVQNGMSIKAGEAFPKTKEIAENDAGTSSYYKDKTYYNHKTLMASDMGEMQVGGATKIWYSNQSLSSKRKMDEGDRVCLVIYPAVLFDKLDQTVNGSSVNYTGRDVYGFVNYTTYISVNR